MSSIKKTASSRKPLLNGWTLIRFFAFLCALLPFLALGGGLFSPPGEYWVYVRSHLLGAYFVETLLLVAGAGLSAGLLGVALAWFIGVYEFRGKKVFELLLTLPLAIPPYIAAYAYEGLLGYTGAAQTFFRNQFGIRLAGLTSAIPAQVWAVWIFTMTLFPYVYLLTRAFLRNQSAAIFENALLLGGGRLRLFRRVGLPLLLPAALSGVILVSLEVLNDFGVAKYYGLNTFTTAIFSAWFGMGDPDTAIKLSLMLLVLVFVILLFRKAAHRARRYHIVSTREKPLVPRRLSGPSQAGVLLLCGLVCFAAFAAPVLQLLYWLYLSREKAFTLDLARAALYTAGVSVAAALIIMIGATATVNANRHFAGRNFKNRFSLFISQGSTLGYAIPSAVLAIGVIGFFTGADRLLGSLFPFLPARVLGKTSLMLIFAYGVRFFSIGYQAAEAGFAKTGMVYTEASRTLGRGISATFFRVELPMIRHALSGGAALVFIDILKELPLSMLLRPFNTETLGTTAYHFANNEVLEQTALPSLCVILVGAVFIALTQLLEKKGKKKLFGSQPGCRTSPGSERRVSGN